MFLIFVNSVLMDLFFEFVIMFSEADLLLTYSTIVRRATIAVVIGGGIVSASLSVSLLVELPGVNESQIRFGQGYGYKMPLDWTKGTILNSYFDKEKKFKV